MNVHVIENITVFTTQTINSTLIKYCLPPLYFTNISLDSERAACSKWQCTFFFFSFQFYPSHPASSSPIIFIIMLPGLSFTYAFSCQRGAGSLLDMNGLRKRPTCQAAPWRSSLRQSLSTRPKDCSTPPPSEGGWTRPPTVTVQVQTPS